LTWFVRFATDAARRPRELLMEEYRAAGELHEGVEAAELYWQLRANPQAWHERERLRCARVELAAMHSSLASSSVGARAPLLQMAISAARAVQPGSPVPSPRRDDAGYWPLVLARMGVHNVHAYSTGMQRGWRGLLARLRVA
jgi:hypothetical protein